MSITVNNSEDLGFINYLSKIGTSIAALAEMIGVSTRTVYRWTKREDVNPSNLALMRIRKINDIFDVLFEALPEDGAVEWLKSYNKYLGGERPLDLLEEGKNEEVYRAAIDIRDNIL